LANVLGGLFAMVDFAGRKVARSNLEVAFGDTFSSAEREQIARQSYRYLARTFVDLAWSPRLTKENFTRWFEIENVDGVRIELGPKQSGIFATIHYGNFEWAAKALGLSGISLLIMMQEFKNPLLDPIVEMLRRHSGHEVAAREGGIIRLFKALKRGHHTGILSDLTLRPTQPSVAIDCFGMKTCVTYAHAWLYKKTGAPIVPVYCEHLPGGKCRFVAQRRLEISADATETEIAQACWDRFEPIIRKNPAQWLWMYKQWRYRPSQTEQPYPFYANTSYYFDQLLVRTPEDLKELRAAYVAALNSE
jgi:KDO2-lipid IV(A) lauroyltransferase